MHKQKDRFLGAKKGLGSERYEEVYKEHLGNAVGMNTKLNLKGIGISFIDNQPTELLYVSLNDLAVIYNYDTTK